MDEREIALGLAADLRALLPVVRHHITMLSTPATARQDPTATPELARLTGTMAAACALAEADDCALLLSSLHDHFTKVPGALQPRFAALVWDALTFVQERVEAMGALVTPRAPTGVQRAQAEHLARALAETPNTSFNGADAPGASLAHLAQPAITRESSTGTTPPYSAAFEPLVVDAAVRAEHTAGSLTENELAMLQSFQSSVLRHPERKPFAPSHVENNARITAPLPALDGDAVSHEAGAGSATEGDRADDATPPWHAPTAEELDFIPPEMKQLFLVETSDDVQDLRLALLRYEQRPDDSSALATMGRIAHKIKGAAATLGFETLAGVLHSFEDVIKALQTRRVGAGAESSEALVREMALVQAALDAARSEAPENAFLVAEAHWVYEALLPETPSDAGNMESVPDRQPVSSDVPLLADSSESPMASAGESESYLRVDVRRLDELMRHISALAVNRAALTQTREEATRLQAEMDQAIRQLNELSGQFTDLQPMLRAPARGDGFTDGSMRRAEASGSRFRFFGRGEATHSGHTDSYTAGANGGKQTWDALELEQFTEFDHALRKLNEVVADVDTTGRQLRALLLRFAQLSEEQSALATRMQRDVMHVRLVPLKSIVPRLELETLRLGSLTGKTVAFSVRGEMTEIDRNISEALAGPLLQLVRNAVVHGIEPPEERRELGKPEVGQVWIHAYHVGSEVIIEVGDDGSGINPHRLTASAVMAGALHPEAARAVSPAEALDLMFLPGVTTFEAAQAVGGRGIGLDDVRTTIQALKGTIAVRSEPGQGAVFRIRVPISLSIVHVLRVDAADQQYAVPFSSVQRTLSLMASELLVSVPSSQDTSGAPAPEPQRRIRIERMDGAPVVGELPEDQRYEEIPVFALAELLGMEHIPREPQMALVIEIERRRVALLVDDVHEDQEVVVQALPSHLRRRVLRGASVTPGGQLLLLLDLPELIAGVLNGTQARVELRPRPIRPAALAPRVLVVDDSVSIRRAVEHTLRRGGFEVDVARDGIEALEVMLTSRPRVLVLDIEMPRLDGFELLSIVRESPRFAGVRVAMLTSRAADKHKEHAHRLGVEAYLVKPCPQETLIETVRALLAEPVVAQ